jgi:hypothetical protein
MVKFDAILVVALAATVSAAVSFLRPTARAAVLGAVAGAAAAVIATVLLWPEGSSNPFADVFYAALAASGVWCAFITSSITFAIRRAVALHRHKLQIPSDAARRRGKHLASRQKGGGKLPP